jgi:hypothetical protein
LTRPDCWGPPPRPFHWTNAAPVGPCNTLYLPFVLTRPGPCRAPGWPTRRGRVLSGREADGLPAGQWPVFIHTETRRDLLFRGDTSNRRRAQRGRGAKSLTARPSEPHGQPGVFLVKIGDFCGGYRRRAWWCRPVAPTAVGKAAGPPQCTGELVESMKTSGRPAVLQRPGQANLGRASAFYLPFGGPCPVRPEQRKAG